MRHIHMGQLVICSETGVIGNVIKFYTPTSCEEQTMVETVDGRKYHAPTRMWSSYLIEKKPKYTISIDEFDMFPSREAAELFIVSRLEEIYLNSK